MHTHEARERATESGREFLFTAADFERVRKLIYGRAGISLSPSKHEMVYSRLGRRLRALGLSDFKGYLLLLEQGDAAEWEAFTNSLTTNLTAFFREEHHFPLLAELLKHHRGSGQIALWCSAASTGEEPYSMAMTAAEAFGTLTPPVRILATDIDTSVLAKAQRGVYAMERLEKMPEERIRRFFLRGKGQHAGQARVRDELRAMINYRPLNLLDAGWPIRGPFHAIFCRNVMIYFDKPTQYAILQKFLPLLHPDGLLFAGHSESFQHAADLFRPRGKTVYEPAGRAARAATEGNADVLAANVYFDNHFDLEAAKLLPGEYYVTGSDMVLVTVLGSCVSACIRDRLSGIGGMNHFMLPDARPDQDSPVSLSARYGAFAMEVLINSLITLGAQRTLLEAKVFGGGNVLPGMTTMNIGQRNADFALGFLSAEKIRVVARDLIDVYPRKVYYFPKSGKVLVKKLRNLHNDTICKRELEYGAHLVKEEVAGDVELFG